MKVSLQLRHGVVRTSLVAAGVTAVAAASLLSAGGAAAAPDAAAASTWTTTAGSARPGTLVTVSGVTTGSTPQVTVTDVTSGTTATCDSGTGTGSGKTGTGLAGKNIYQLDGSKLKVTNCIGPLNLHLLLDGSGLWSLNALSYRNGVTTGTLTGIKANIHTADPSQCSFVGSGSVKGTYDNATQTLATNPNSATLRISNVKGCFGLIANGDKGTIALKVKLTADNPAYNPLKITSP